MAAKFDKEIRRIEAEIARQKKRITDSSIRRDGKVEAAMREHDGNVNLIQPIIDSLTKARDAMKATDSTQQQSA